MNASLPLTIIAPGRVNLLGEHVDYNGGVVLPAAIDRVVTLRAAPSAERIAHLTAEDLGETVSLNLDRLDEKQDADGRPLPSWAIYPAGVAWAAARRGLPLRGCQAAYASTVPIGAGLSSSAAVETAFAALWRELGGWPMDNLELAQLCQQAENQYAGVNCGLMDQFASANGVEDCALYFDTRSLHWEALPLPDEVSIVIADSSVRRSLATSAYNDRRAACEEALRILRGPLAHIRDLRDVSPAEFDAHQALLPEIPRKRARHVVNECHRVESAVAALRGGDAAAFGKLMFTCHESLRDDFEVSCPELNALVEIAAGLPGCLGARLTGAGFGGCTVNLVRADDAVGFAARLGERYQQTCGRKAEVYLCRASRGVRLA